MPLFTHVPGAGCVEQSVVVFWPPVQTTRVLPSQVVPSVHADGAGATHVAVLFSSLHVCFGVIVEHLSPSVHFPSLHIMTVFFELLHFFAPSVHSGALHDLLLLSQIM